jgi:CheY-like chemotaxis protein
LLPALHLLLVEPELRHAQQLMCLLSSLGVVTTRAATPGQATTLLTQLLPDGLLVGVHPLNIRDLRPWLAGLLADSPPWTLVYAEHEALLAVAQLGLPPLASARWPCSADDLALLLAPLLSVGAR